MLEEIISKCIMHYLKEYLKQLDSNQLDLEVLQGMAKIRNLQLLPTALTQHFIPFIIRKGCIKYVEVIFPWNNIKNAACDIKAEDIFFVLQFDSSILLKSDIQADHKSIHLNNESFTIPHDDQVKIIQGLFESVIDNLHIHIKNIHLRIEFPCDPKPIIIGISMPDIIFQTVDENGIPVNSIQHPKFVRKELTIKNFSIYFDTDDDMMIIKDDEEFQNLNESIQSFTDAMIKEMNKEHQYFIQPTLFKSLLIHTKDKTQKITNQIQTIINEISLNLDLPQCRSIIHLNFLWNQFMKRRKYANCMRPISFSSINETWQYAHKCAIVKNMHQIFQPYLAITILKNRIKYVKLFKKAKKSKLSVNLLGSPKQKLASLEKKIGSSATIYLREYADSIFIKEESMKDQPNVTAFDISELKSIFESTEIVFSMKQFASSFEINSFNLNLLYDKKAPLISFSCKNISGKLCSLDNTINMNIHINDASIVSFINGSSRPKIVLQKMNHDKDSDKNDFIFLNSIIPINDYVSSFECIVAPIKLTLDNKTISCIFDYFNIPSTKQIDSNNNEISRFEIGELFQFVKSFVNYKMLFKISLIAYDFQYKSKNNEIKHISFELADLNFHKSVDQFFSKKDQKITLNFSGKMNLKAKINNFILFKTDDISAQTSLIFINEKIGVTLNHIVDFGVFQIYLSKEYLTEISYALKSILKLSIPSSSVLLNVPPPPVLIVGRSKINFDIKLNAINIFITDEIRENEMLVTIGDLNGSVNYYLTSFKYSLILKNLTITQFNKAFVTIQKQIDINIIKSSDLDPLVIDVSVSKPHIWLEFKSIFWIIEFMYHTQDVLIKNESNDINLSENISESENSSEQITLASTMQTNQFAQTLIMNEPRINLKRDFIPSNIILSNLVLTKSIDEYLQGSLSFEAIPILHIENKKDDNEELSNENLIHEPLPKNKTKNVHLNLKVSEFCMEMIDNGEKKINSLFTIKSLSVLVFSPTEYKIGIEDFFIRRETRTIFYVPHLIIPINLPNPIEVVADYAEAHIYSGDLIALTYNSSLIFKLLFCSKYPLFKNELIVHALAKTGRGSTRKENNEPITTVEVADAYVSISFNQRTLTVNAKLKKCDGVYYEDNSHFITLYNDFYCHYMGTPNNQEISIDVPNAKLTLKHVFLPWFLIFAPLTHVDKSTLQPLKYLFSQDN